MGLVEATVCSESGRSESAPTASVIADWEDGESLWLLGLPHSQALGRSSQYTRARTSLAQREWPTARVMLGSVLAVGGLDFSASAVRASVEQDANDPSGRYGMGRDCPRDLWVMSPTKYRA